MIYRYIYNNLLRKYALIKIKRRIMNISVGEEANLFKLNTFINCSVRISKRSSKNFIHRRTISQNQKLLFRFNLCLRTNHKLIIKVRNARRLSRSIWNFSSWLRFYNIILDNQSSNFHIRSRNQVHNQEHNIRETIQESDSNRKSHDIWRVKWNLSSKTDECSVFIKREKEVSQS